MSHRGTRRLLPALSVCAIAVLPGCAGGDAAAAPSAPRKFEATFEVERPLQVVAGNGQAWLLAEADGGAALSRIDHTGRVTDVADLTGQTHHMAPFRDGVVVARIACDGDACEETVAKVLVVDSDGSTVSETEFAREPGSPDRSDGVRVFGFYEEVIWIQTSAGLVGFDATTGRTDPRDPTDVPLRIYEEETDWLADESPTVVAECVREVGTSTPARCSLRSP
jgi:hypothetical protein